MNSIMKKIVKHHADLTLIVSLEHIDNAGNGRLNRLIKQAVKEAIKESRKLQLPPLSENKTILENYDYKKLSGILIEIMLFFERGGNAPAACFWSGELAYEKWARISETD